MLEEYYSVLLIIQGNGEEGFMDNWVTRLIQYAYFIEPWTKIKLLFIIYIIYM